MRPARSSARWARSPYATSKKALPSSAVSNTKVEVWKIGHLRAPSESDGS